MREDEREGVPPSEVASSDLLILRAVGISASFEGNKDLEDEVKVERRPERSFVFDSDTPCLVRSESASKDVWFELEAEGDTRTMSPDLLFGEANGIGIALVADAVRTAVSKVERSLFESKCRDELADNMDESVS